MAMCERVSENGVESLELVVLGASVKMNGPAGPARESKRRSGGTDFGTPMNHNSRFNPLAPEFSLKF